MTLLTELRKWMLVILIGFLVFLGDRYFSKKEDATTITYDTALIQQQIKNVGKLVVTEGHFAEVLTYKDQKKYLGSLISFEKKALVVVNADVTVGFDLSLIEYQIDSVNKEVTILKIPKEEIKISTDLKYYDTESSQLNEFTGEDYNKIAKIAKANIARKIEKSSLKKNAQNRLLSELSKILLLTNSMGWKLQYKDQNIKNEQELNKQFEF